MIPCGKQFNIGDAGTLLSFAGAQFPSIKPCACSVAYLRSGGADARRKWAPNGWHPRSWGRTHRLSWLTHKRNVWRRTTNCDKMRRSLPATKDVNDPTWERWPRNAPHTVSRTKVYRGDHSTNAPRTRPIVILCVVLLEKECMHAISQTATPAVTWCGGLADRVHAFFLQKYYTKNDYWACAGRIC